jgi:hypothetical protein
MIFTLTTLPSPADTHGNHKPNVMTPRSSVAPKVPKGSRFSAMDSR